MFKIGFKVDYLKLESEILKEVRSRFDTELTKIIPTIFRECLTSIEPTFKNNSTYLSLLNGILRTDLGLVDPNAAIDAIIQYISSHMFWKKNSSSINRSMVTSGFIIGINIGDLSDIIAFQSLAGSPIPWLDWLLTRGTQIIITDFSVSYDHSSPNSRTGSSIMVKDKAGYSIPSEFAGTISDNFITKTFVILSKLFEDITQRHMLRIRI